MSNIIYNTLKFFYAVTKGSVYSMLIIAVLNIFSMGFIVHPLFLYLLIFLSLFI